MSLCGSVNDGEAFKRRTVALIALNTLDRQHKKGGTNVDNYIHELKLLGVKRPMKTINEMCNAGIVIQNEKGRYIPNKNWVAVDELEPNSKSPNKLITTNSWIQDCDSIVLDPEVSDNQSEIQEETTYDETLKHILIASLNSEINFLRKQIDKKDETIDNLLVLLSEKPKQENQHKPEVHTPFERNYQRHQNKQQRNEGRWNEQPYTNSNRNRTQIPPVRPKSPGIPVKNKYGPLRFENNSNANDEHTSSCHYTENNVTQDKKETFNTATTKMEKNKTTQAFDVKNAKPPSRPDIRPGYAKYSEALNNTTSIFTDSMMGGVKAYGLKKRLRENDANAHVIFHRHPGATSEQILQYSSCDISSDRPSQAIICAGTNDLNIDGRTDEMIAESLISLGENAAIGGAKKIMINSIIERKSTDYSRRVCNINNILYDACHDKGFVFIDNSNITRDDIANDGVHLLERGTKLFFNNLMGVLS